VIGKRVKMVVGDSWAKPGWIGKVISMSKNGHNALVRWDNGKRLHHRITDMILADTEDDPNTAFCLHKLRKKGYKL